MYGRYAFTFMYSHLRILIVDDNEPAAQVLGKLLTFRGHTTSMVHTGEEALEALNACHAHIALIDIGLPGMSGYEVAQQIRESGCAIPLIAVTGYGQEEDKRKALAAGFNHHLTKPVGLVDLERALAALTAPLSEKAAS